MSKLSPAQKQEKINLIDKIISVNTQINCLKNELVNISKKHKIFTRIDNANDIIYLIFRQAPDEESRSQLLIKYISENPKIGLEYLDSVSNAYIKPGKELETVLQHFINDSDIVFKFIQNIGHTLYSDIWAICSGWRRMYFNRYPHRENLKYVALSIQESKIAFMQKYLDSIWSRYHELLYQKSRRGPKLMFILWILFQEHFTDDMFNTLAKRLSVYKDDFMLQYVLKGSRIKLPDEWKTKLEATYTLLNMEPAPF